MNVSDKELIKKTLAGSHRAFGLLIERYQGFVFTLCLQLLKSREEAEETAQDAFLKVHKKLSSYKHESQFSTWLYTLTYRTALDKLKLRKKQTYSIESENVPLQIAASRTTEAGFSVEQQDLKNLLNIAMKHLSANDAGIINLFYLHGQSVKEISKVMDLSVTNVKTKLFRAREKLKKQLNESYFSEIESLINP